MELTIIAAISRNWAIGYQGNLPWPKGTYPEDMRRFRQLTMGKPILMGRKTFDSILLRNGGNPLDGRLNVVLTRRIGNRIHQGVLFYDSFEDALNVLEENKEVCVIGGERVYKQAIKDSRTTKLEITHIDKEYPGDSYFPEIDRNVWKINPGSEIQREGYCFVTYGRNS